MRVAIIGTVGVPAKYGGFETLVENIIGENCSPEVQYTVYCSAKSYKNRVTTYKGAKLKYISLNANGLQSIFYDIWSIISALRSNDVLLVLGVSGTIILPFVRLFSRKRIIVNIDGLEHRRDKWSGAIKKYLKFSEKLAIKYADVIIADNQAIAEYIEQEYRRLDARVIAYGGDHVDVNTEDIKSSVLAKYNLLPKEYSFSLCRIEPENNVHITLEAFAKSTEKIVFVGNWSNSQYGVELKNRYQLNENVILLDAIYDVKELSVLRSNCNLYIHGHSAGGTNPSLVEAMFFNIPIFAFDCSYNRYSTQNQAFYYSTTESLLKLLNRHNLEQLEHCACQMGQIAKQKYRWADIAKQYEELY